MYKILILKLSAGLKSRPMLGFNVQLDKAKFRMRLVRELLDIIALKYIMDNGNLAGYNFMKWVHEKYGVLLSSGTVYSKLDCLKKEGLVKIERRERKKIYALAEKGKATLKSLLSEPTTEQFLTLLEKPLSRGRNENPK